MPEHAEQKHITLQMNAEAISNKQISASVASLNTIYLTTTSTHLKIE